MVGLGALCSRVRVKRSSDKILIRRQIESDVRLESEININCISFYVDTYFSVCFVFVINKMAGAKL